MMLTDSEQRLRHTDGIYVPKNTVEQLGLLEETFRIVKRAETSDRKIRAAVKSQILPKLKGAASYQAALEKGVITKEEQADLTRAEELRVQAIQVDDFSQEEYLHHTSTGALRKLQEKEKSARPELAGTVA